MKFGLLAEPPLTPPLPKPKGRLQKKKVKLGLLAEPHQAPPCPPHLGPVIRSIFLLPVSNLHPSKHETVLKDNCITSDVPGKMQTKSSNSFNVLEELRGGW